MAESTRELKDYLTAREVQAELGIKPHTLYAYVSRGLIRSVSRTGLRGHFYPREDVDKVRMRSLARAGHGPVAASAMHWGGEPVIDSSITDLTAEGPRYRGRLATEPAQTRHSFECVAE